MNVLFICSKNQWRSPTAEVIFKNHAFANTKSAGTSPSARIKLNQKHLDWADLIFVMEKKHRQIIAQRFEKSLVLQKIIVLDIPDEYRYMYQELIAEITQKVTPYL